MVTIDPLEHEGLIHAALKDMKYLYAQGRPMDYDDCFQSGFIALLEALETYSSDKGAISTYVIPRIKWALQRENRASGDLIRKPTRHHTAYWKCKKAIAQFTQEHQREPEPREIPRIVQMPLKEYQAMKSLFSPVAALDAPLPGQTDITLMDAILEELKDERDDYEEVDAREDRRRLRKMLEELMVDTLHPRERDALKLYYGWDGTDPITVAGVAALLNLSETRARSLINSALRKLRKSARYLAGKFPELLAYQVYRSYGDSSGEDKKIMAQGLFARWASLGDLVEVNRKYLGVITELGEAEFTVKVNGMDQVRKYKSIRDIEIKDRKVTKVFSW